MSVGLPSIVLLIFALGFSIKPLAASQKGISATNDGEKVIKDDCSSTSSQPTFLSSVSLLIKKLLPKRCNSDAEKVAKNSKRPGNPEETGGTTSGWKRPKYMHVGYNKKNNKLFKVVGDVDIRDGQDKTNNTLQFQQTINILSNFVKKPEKRHQF